MNLLIGLLAPKLGKGFASVIVYGGLILLLGLALWWLRHDAYGDGRRDERAAWEQVAERLKAKAEHLQRLADHVRQAAEQVDRDRIQRNRQEIDDALRNIPDQRTSPRQHARACIELRRQGQNPPACQS